MLNLNPEIVDQEKIRKLKRRRLFKIAIVPIIILSLTGLFFLRTGLFNVIYSTSYNSGSYDSAKMTADVQSIANVITPYIMYFDRGDALYKSGDYSGAEKEFKSSLKENPPSSELCKIYVNLSLSVEKQGDEKYNGNNYDEALVLYNSAEAILYENGCASKHNNEEGKDRRADNSRDRVIEKRRKTISAINSSENAGGEGGGESGNDNNRGVSGNDLEKIQGNQNTEEALNNIRNGLNRAGGSGGSYHGSSDPSW